MGDLHDMWILSQQSYSKKVFKYISDQEVIPVNLIKFLLGLFFAVGHVLSIGGVTLLDPNMFGSCVRNSTLNHVI